MVKKGILNDILTLEQSMPLAPPDAWYRIRKAALTASVQEGDVREAVERIGRFKNNFPVSEQPYIETLIDAATRQDDVARLERILHNKEHGTPNDREDCARYRYMTFHKRDDGTVGHSSSGMLPDEDVLSVFSAATRHVPMEVVDILHRLSRTKNYPFAQELIDKALALLGKDKG